MNKTVYDPTLIPKSWLREDSHKKPHANMKGESQHHNRSGRTDTSLVPPIRQTASIFKQPVTIYRNTDASGKSDLKYGLQEKPRQLLWEKRLERLRARDISGHELRVTSLPSRFRAAGPNISQETILQSLATALHIYNHPIIGQTSSLIEKNPCIYLNPEQPLIQAITITEDDLRKQEEKVNAARLKLQIAMQMLS